MGGSQFVWMAASAARLFVPFTTPAEMTSPVSEPLEPRRAFAALPESRWRGERDVPRVPFGAAEVAAVAVVVAAFSQRYGRGRALPQPGVHRAARAWYLYEN